MGEAGAVALPETALVTLCFRANEARRPDGIIDDPVAIELTETVDYDFTNLRRSKRQDLALRAFAFDSEARRYLAGHPEATVVALGEGMQTSFWRLDSAGLGDKFRWLTIDLPPNIALRERLLPRSPRISMCAQSALDFSWMDRVDPGNGVFITAEGILPYLEPEQALGLIAECARRFPGGEMMFDLPTKLQAVRSRRRMRKTPQSAWPPTPFGLSAREIANLPVPRGRGPGFNALWKTRELPIYEPLRWLVGIKWPTLASLTLLEFDA
jgi:O-methyltransferase involved in polyketide biosynthesis